MLRAGDVAGDVYFVVTGLLRYYYVDAASGETRTGQFFEVTSVNVVEIPDWPIEVIGQAACVDMLRSGSTCAASMSAKASTCM